MICTTSSHIIWKENTCNPGSSLVVQWLSLHTLNTRGQDLIPDQGTRSYILQPRPNTEKKKKKCWHSIHSTFLQAGIWWVSGKLALVNHVDENNTPEERAVRLEKLESVDNCKGQKNDDSSRLLASVLTWERKGDSCPIWAALFWGLLFWQPS